ncbi:MAG: epimerase [Deltaproteobacteria bacterium CG2_30_63_29]|nr:MAG: epimerase [Deltaproteobacteria bacterium CG2_30_63_29]PIW00007.1 MAG: epimerase [Deltaproteobacteria bacterium CG17_big_fil_post_rev_8_21_14_2_50_63_7]PJB37025.1 MAG: epimerase [Deltaproteobacteria bacterium CG_4_9_14_3_um_filter_63_12]
MSGKHALVTGGAGFIGSHLVDRLLGEGWRVTVVDNFDPFYARSVKEGNIRSHREHPNYHLIECDLRDRDGLVAAFESPFDCIVHLAARAGVRPSIADPVGYQSVNVTGTQNLLELAKDWGCKQFVFASSSSVYGINPDVPWREEGAVLQPISPYASTKVSGELMGHVYSHLYRIRFVALRFFTVIGPRQRPDLALHKFAKMMLAGQKLPKFGDGETSRDYTFVADIVSGVCAAMEYDASLYEVINLGNHQTITLNEMIGALELSLNRTAELESLPEQPGDVPRTWADISKAQRLLNYQPTTPFRAGVEHFVRWFLANR